ncbi:hypothetical protein PP175_26080 (plasmid) [Aneurinibacillus sp. Ricciae_BoGa-3]|uniref:hypothetical protein n=1 Tax=Aneurinibacillus sp. Ricciae_BoGa-3 TaxID=3022697 RepID=UPI0023422E57|nr:hypothetical protein [Aneurinibacillus sp. Ricciae_BoGa-3]WCK57536.1 hypothetical protein PP175_26080 [Aneurinibacillus sp. Ricciae_BoGa-3]
MTVEQWETGDFCELISTRFEDSGLLFGDTGKVIDVQQTRFCTDIRIQWDSGAVTCWIPVEDCLRIS